MMIALNAKNKLKLVTVNSIHRALWERTNDMIISWILNTIDEQISNSLNLFNTACDLWKELQEHYSQLDGHRVYQLTNDLVQLKQNNLAIEIYYHKMKGLWDEYDSLEAPYMCVCACVCENGRINGERDQRKRLIQFLMGLDECYANVRGTHTVATQGLTIQDLEETIVKGNHLQEITIRVDIAYKIVGYPVGHPLHGKYKPSNQTLKNNTQDNNRTINMTMSQGNSNESAVTTTSNDAAMNARMDQLQNQLNQMILMMQNNKEINGMPFMSNEGKPKLIASCFTKLCKFIASHVSAKRTTTRKLLMAAFIMDCTSSNKNPKHLLLPSSTSTQTTWLSGIQDLDIPHFLF
ncbi:cysteine-rich receptor-like protein kinase 8 [Tanacetum coccineum]